MNPETALGRGDGRTPGPRAAAKRSKSGLGSNRRFLRKALLTSITLLAAGFGLQAWAQASASYQIPRQSIDAGGGRSASPSYELVAVSGQPEAAAPMSSSHYALRGGVLRAAELTPTGDPIFANGFEP